MTITAIAVAAWLYICGLGTMACYLHEIATDDDDTIKRLWVMIFWPIAATACCVVILCNFKQFRERMKFK